MGWSVWGGMIFLSSYFGIYAVQTENRFLRLVLGEVKITHPHKLRDLTHLTHRLVIHINYGRCCA